MAMMPTGVHWLRMLKKLRTLKNDGLPTITAMSRAAKAMRTP
jgi:hypothetical protein